MRRGIVCLAIATIVLGLVPGVCHVMPDRAKAQDAAMPKKMKIGVSIPAADHGWTAGIGWWAKRAMALHPEIEWSYATAASPEKQVADVQDMMTKGVDGLVILATESAQLTPVAKQAHDRGIYIVNVDRGFLEPVADVFLEGDNKAFGRKSAEFIAKKMNGKGNLVILTGIPCTVDTDRVQAALDVLKKYPEIKILSQQEVDWSREKATNVTQNLLTQFPKIDAIWAQDDDSLLGAQQAVKQAGRDKDLFILGGAGMKDVIKQVMDKDPLVPGDITYPPSMIAAGIHLAASNLRDGRQKFISQFQPKHVTLDVELVTPENAKDFYFPDSVY